MSERTGVCIHGGLRRQCEACDSAEEVVELKAEVESLRADLERIRTAAQAFLDKLAEVEEATRGVYVIAQVHGCGYSGPSYNDERKALLTALTADAPRTET